MKRRRRPPLTYTGEHHIHTRLRRIAGLVWVTHPLASTLYALAAGLFGAVAAAAARRPLDGWTLARLTLGVFCIHAAIAGVNDYCNRYLDAVWHRAGPIVRGLIQPWEAFLPPIAVTALMLVLFASLGMLPLLLACAILVLGLLGVLYFKGSPVSAALYALYYPLIPLLAWSVFGRWQPFLPWLLLLGAAQGIALHVAATLPNLEGEAAMGLRGLPHRLGPSRGRVVSWGTAPLLVCIVWVLSLTQVVPAHESWLAVATVVALLSVALAMAIYAVRPTSGSLHIGFVIQAVGTIVFATCWLSAVAF